jgi:hypothetical protein
MYISQHAQYYPAVAEQADTWVRAGEAVQQASETANSAGLFDPSSFKFDPGKLDPERSSPQDIGQEAHRQFRKEFQDQMAEKGRTEKPGDFLTENAIRDAEGNVVRIDGQFGKPDAVDYKSHIIYDLKPWDPRGVDRILARYSDQIHFYKELYIQAYGIEPEIVIVPYGGP